ncbi:MAG TPA: CPBP family intramembrane glutamic endopeptidase [Trueperaceae bacterium]|nr:CPBP family intramembrane glutamic endopeptidase [Trueperaceae bacterium]
MNLVFVRIALLFAAAAATALIVSAAARTPFSLALTPQLSALYFVPANIACLLILRRSLRARGSSLRRLADFDRTRFGSDVLRGLLWLFVLFIPFAAALNLAMLVLFGPSGMIGAYETVFAPDPAQLVAFAPWFAWGSAAVTAVLFPVTNAPAEELVFRGHAQGGLFDARRPAWLALGLPAVAFGIQHVLLAPSATGMLVYACAFFGWGLGAGIIYRRTGRLMPVIIAHFFTNLMAIAPIVILAFDPF